MKESVMIDMLGDPFNQAMINMAVAAGGQTPKEIAETFAQGAINENPEETDCKVLCASAMATLKVSLG